jgi:aerobic carbon-monoxide dehydrogenase large subunit
MACIGKAVPGKLDHILVAGKGQYTADIALPGMGFMTVLRSPFAHAKITSIDVEAVRRLPGVRIVITDKDILAFASCWARPCPSSSLQGTRN